jgi:hypothetical protein
VLEFRLGWSIADRPEGAFEFWAFLLSLWAGAVLLSFDLKRGVLRVLVPLPLTARQIGRGWWVATVAITFLKSYTFILAPASLCVFFVVWRGDGMLAYALLIFTMFGFLQMHGWLQVFLHNPEIPFNLIGPIVSTSVLLALLLTRCTLRHSRRAYRVQLNPFGNPWGTGR